jgi:flagellar M-ring protein FliF
MTVDVDQLRRRAKHVLDGYTPGQRAVIGIAVLALLVGGYMFTKWSSQPHYASLFSNLETSDASAVTDKLTAKKIPFKLTDGGTTIQVPREKVYQTRLDLSADGLPNGGSSGYALLDKQGITTSEFRQRVDYQRALEGELAKTVKAIDGVASVSVHLVIPPQDVFAESTSPSSASVLIRMDPGKTMSPAQAKTVVNLVSSSVAGLKREAVTVADTRGVVLSDESGGTVDMQSQADTVRSYESRVAQSLQAMLGRVLGPDHAVVQVTADLDLDQRQKTVESYDNTNPPQAVNEAVTKEAYKGTAAGLPGGVLGPEATTASTTADAGANDYSKEEATRNYAIGKTVEAVTAAPGTVKRLSVAVLLDENAPTADVAKVEQLVRAATGMQDSRGDTIAVTRLPFDQTAAEQAQKALDADKRGKQMETLVGAARAAVALLAVAVTLLFLVRRSRRNERVPVALPLPAGSTVGENLDAMHAEIDLTEEPTAAIAPPETQALERAPARRAAVDNVEIEERSRIQRQVGDLIERQPEDVAQLLRSWLADRRS